MGSMDDAAKMLHDEGYTFPAGWWGAASYLQAIAFARDTERRLEEIRQLQEEEERQAYERQLWLLGIDPEKWEKVMAAVASLGVSLETIAAAINAFAAGAAAGFGYAEGMLEATDATEIEPRRAYRVETPIERPPRVLGAPGAPWRPHGVRHTRRHGRRR